MHKKQTIYKICITAVLCVLAIIANRFLSFNVWNLSLGISFLPILICALVLGPVYGGICGGLADLIGAVLFPFGPFFPGFTLTAFISGFLFGLIKTNGSKGQFLLTCFSVFFIEEILCTVLLNSLWISVLFDSPFLPLLLTRIPKAAVMICLEIAAAFIIKSHLLKPIEKMIK